MPCPADTTDTLCGRCHCGRVRFEITLPASLCSHCHCESCRRLHGAALVTWTAVPDTRFSLQSQADSVAWYASSPGVHWGSCAHCHSRLFNRADQHADTRGDHWYIAVASLDPPHGLQPSAHVSAEEAVPWFTFDDALPRVTGKD